MEKSRSLANIEERVENILLKLKGEIQDYEAEILELRLLYKEGKIPYKVLDSRIHEIINYIKEDISDELLRV